jgi:hypothetical protein
MSCGGMSWCVAKRHLQVGFGSPATCKSGSLVIFHPRTCSSFYLKPWLFLHVHHFTWNHGFHRCLLMFTIVHMLLHAHPNFRGFPGEVSWIATSGPFKEVAIDEEQHRGHENGGRIIHLRKAIEKPMVWQMKNCWPAEFRRFGLGLCNSSGPWLGLFPTGSQFRATVFGTQKRNFHSHIYFGGWHENGWRYQPPDVWCASRPCPTSHPPYCLRERPAEKEGVFATALGHL